jgi:hypothetical protein
MRGPEGQSHSMPDPDAGDQYCAENARTISGSRKLWRASASTRAAPLALQTHRDRRWLSCSRTCRVSAAVTEMPRPPLNRAEEFPQLLRGGSAGIRNTPSEGATSGLARASGSTPGLALRDGPRQTPRRGEHFLQSDECRRISALSFWALYTSRQTDAPLAKSVLLADRCCAGRSKHKSVYSTPGTFLLSPQRCHRSAKDAQLPFHVCAIANVVGSHLQRRCIHSNRLSVLSGVSYHLDPSGLGPSVTTPDKSHHQIMRLGLNRYAVLGRSSRLWSSVVLNQASLFAILHA